jgi:hypothetical protein
MTPKRGYYCIIQYCPDLGRLEAANIGVLLLCSELDFLKARTSKDNARIRRFFRGERHDWDRINSYKLGIEQRLQAEHDEIRSLESLEHFIAKRANFIQITPPRPMKVRDPDKDLDQLFQDLVGGEARKSHQMSMKSYLLDRFTNAGLSNKIKIDIPVTVPIFDRQIEFPCGFQNGRFNLIQLAGFEAANAENAKATACRYAIEGRSLYEHKDPALGELQLIVVGKFGTNKSQSRPGVERILREHNVRLYATTELNSLVDEIRRTAKEFPETDA